MAAQTAHFFSDRHGSPSSRHHKIELVSGDDSLPNSQTLPSRCVLIWQKESRGAHGGPSHEDVDPLRKTAPVEINPLSKVLPSNSITLGVIISAYKR